MVMKSILGSVAATTPNRWSLDGYDRIDARSRRAFDEGHEELQRGDYRGVTRDGTTICER